MSKIRGYVLDSDTESPIAGVAIYLVSPLGHNAGMIGQTDEDGDYAFDLPDSGAKVEFDFPGYAPKVVDPTLIGASGKILLDPDPSNQIEGVVVVSKRKLVKKPKYILPAVLGIAATALFITSMKIK